MTRFSPDDHPHRRQNLLTGKWVLVSPHRAKRPWQGETGDPAPRDGARHDPACYLCPGNARTSGDRNPDYVGAFAFDNDFPALMPDNPAPDSADDVFRMAEARGTARVICYSPDHSKTMPDMALPAIRSIVDCWADESAALAPRFANVAVFENKGAMMGCSNPHPHSQLWAQSQMPNEVSKEFAAQTDYFKANGRPLLVDYITEEQKRQDRILAVNDHFTALVPFWAVWPFEVMVVAHRPTAYLSDLTPS
ncbi:MAG: galactose-1-phosphate uridylyltransferase, partial [Novosphingobium sp.]|nr:galactose-1-phosphate uridylyltransferase [Novosphingobium sp.]